MCRVPTGSIADKDRVGLPSCRICLQEYLGTGSFCQLFTLSKAGSPQADVDRYFDF
jgi:hypothetical protein